MGIGEEGTARWSLLLYVTHTAAHDKQYLAPARRALGWCLDNQYAGPDPQARGSLPGSNPSCAYASGFFGLTVLEELKLVQNTSRAPN